MGLVSGKIEEPSVDPAEYDAFNPEPIDPDIGEESRRIEVAARILPHLLADHPNKDRVINQGDKRRQICKQAVALADELISIAYES